MKYTLSGPTEFWNGKTPLPETIHVLSSQPHIAEFELLTMLGGLHGYVTAFDILTGSEEGSEKDTDLTAVLTAFQQYLAPKMPLSHYTGKDKRMVPLTDQKVVPNPI